MCLRDQLPWWLAVLKMLREAVVCYQSSRNIFMHLGHKLNKNSHLIAGFSVANPVHLLKCSEKTEQQ